MRAEQVTWLEQRVRRGQRDALAAEVVRPAGRDGGRGAAARLPHGLPPRRAPRAARRGRQPGGRALPQPAVGPAVHPQPRRQRRRRAAVGAGALPLMDDAAIVALLSGIEPSEGEIPKPPFMAAVPAGPVLESEADVEAVEAWVKARGGWTHRAPAHLDPERPPLFFIVPKGHLQTRPGPAVADAGQPRRRRPAAPPAPRRAAPAGGPGRRRRSWRSPPPRTSPPRAPSTSAASAWRSPARARSRSRSTAAARRCGSCSSRSP